MNRSATELKWESKVSADCNWPTEDTVLHDRHVAVARQAAELASLRTRLEAAEQDCEDTLRLHMELKQMEIGKLETRLAAAEAKSVLADEFVTKVDTDDDAAWDKPFWFAWKARYDACSAAAQESSTEPTGKNLGD